MLTGQATSKTVGEGVGAGTKTVGEGVGAGTKTAGSVAGALLIGVSAAFLIVDTVDLGR